MGQSNPRGHRAIKATGTPSCLALVKVMNMLTDLSQKVSSGMNEHNLKTMCIQAGKPCRDTGFSLLRSSSLKYLECCHRISHQLKCLAVQSARIINRNTKFLKEQIQENISVMKIINKCSSFQIQTYSDTVL